MKYVLAIDQGGTKTHALIGNEQGRILGVGTGPGGCHSVDGMNKAMEGVTAAVCEALKQSGLSLENIDAVAAGMTGVDWPEEAGLLEQALCETLHIELDRIHVVNDCIIALRSATSVPMGLVLCAGTGLNCAVRDGQGHEYAFGYYISDQDQGGMALANRVLQAVFDAESGLGAATALTERCLSATCCDSVDALLRKRVEGRLTHEEKNALPIIAEEEALSGDPVAAKLLIRFGRDEAAYAAAAIRRFHLEDAPIDVVLSGSIFKCKAPMLLNAVRETILEAAPRARIIESAFEPVIGAFLLGLDDLGIGDSAALQMHIERDAQRFHMVRDTLTAKERVS